MEERVQFVMEVRIKWVQIPELVKDVLLSRHLRLVAQHCQHVYATQGIQEQMEQHVQFALVVHMTMVWGPELV